MMLRKVGWGWVALASAATALGAAAATADARALARGIRALERGDPEAAVEALEGRDGERNGALVLGTALLEAGRPAEAVQALSRAVAVAASPEARRRGLHNLSVAHLHVAAAALGGRDVHARAAAAAAMDALRMAPWDATTRWNLAVALRMVEGDGARGEPTQRRDGGLPLRTGQGGGEATDGSPTTPMTPEEARRILDALRSAEGPGVAEGAARLFGGRNRDSTGRGPPW